MPFVSITDNQYSSFVRSLTSGHYTLLLGSGISTDSSNSNGQLPSADQLRVDLCELKNVPTTAPLQQVFSLLNTNEVHEYVTSRFLDCNPGRNVTKFPRFLWKRIFTFNIDDALEHAYARARSLQTPHPRHFADQYEDVGPLADLQIVHLHGYVHQEDRGYVFSRNQYIQHLKENNPWMTILAQLVTSDPIIVIGSSFDEVDLDYYLSYRRSTSGRTDQGPSVFVSPDDDALIRHHCEQHGMLHFRGTSEQFLNHCEDLIPNRPTPSELIPQASRHLFDEQFSERQVLAFWSDFELVPGTEEIESATSRFLYGHSPTWNDLASNLDVSREVSAQVIVDVEGRLEDGDEQCKLVILFEMAGAGKTTVLSRCAYELARRGIITLRCTALSRLEPTTTTALLTSIDRPIVVVVDNFADQVTSFVPIIEGIGGRQIVILASERSYRRRYVTQALSGLQYRPFNRLPLGRQEVEGLVDKYVGFGLVGESRAISERRAFANEAANDPIAVACCRILNDFRPLERIVEDIVRDGGEEERLRYVMTAVARHCFSGGIRYSIIASAYGNSGWDAQFRRDNPLPLAFVMDGGRGFVIPENTILSGRVLERYRREDVEFLFGVFVDLAIRIAPHVNRESIRRRSPEARLAGRLFDYDDVVEQLLGDRSGAFYDSTQEAWQWNSRYWEQVALLHLGRYRKGGTEDERREALGLAVQHARHAVSVERHPFTLTTLGQALIAEMTVGEIVSAGSYSEAFEKLNLAIRLERNRARMAVQPFITLFRGSRAYLERGGILSTSQTADLRRLIGEARGKFPRDGEIIDLSNGLEQWLRRV